VGSVLSPALVILHLQPDELARVPRPVVAYGLIEDVADARACGEFADAIVVRPAVAAKLAAQVGAALADEERVLLGSSVGSAP
jgi:hypothetical protein